MIPPVDFHVGIKVSARRKGFGGRVVVREVVKLLGHGGPNPLIRYVERDPALEGHVEGTCTATMLRKWADRLVVESPASHFHPLCTLFPHDPDAVAHLVEDIRAQGQLEPVVMLEGQILDGRHRWLACEALGIEPRTVEFADVAGPSADPEAWVFSRNLARRQLSPGQRALLAARLAELRRTAPHRPTGKGSEAYGQLLGVSSRTVEHAAAVLRNGTPELVAALEAGHVRPTPAAQLAQLPPDEQRQIIAGADRKVIKAAAKQIKSDERAEKAARRLAELPTRAQKCAPGIELVLGETGDHLKRLRREPARFGVVLADPPWLYRNTPVNGGVADHYPSLPDDQIAQQVNEAAGVALKDAWLILWVTGPKLVEAVTMLDLHQGWSYVAQFCWTKREIGTGYVTRSQHELALIYKKGSPPLPSPALPSHFSSSRMGLEHSEKPREFLAQLFEAFAPGTPVLDLYAGLGSGALAAQDVGRPYFGIELVPSRHARALARVAAANPSPIPQPEPADAHM